MFSGKCENCSKSITHADGIKVGGSYWITTSGDWFCSNKCKDEFANRKNQQNSNSNNSNETTKSHPVDTVSSKEAQAKTEEARQVAQAERAKAQAIEEQEYTKRHIASQQVELEKHKIKEQKIEKLRAEKKYIKVFVLEHPFITGLIVFIMVIMFFRVLGSVRDSKEEHQIEIVKVSNEESLNLEKIENELVLGINSKEPKEKLLEMVSKLDHKDNVNKIEGKKNDVIIGILGPNYDFDGSFSEYWIAKRDAYKKMINEGLTVAEYFKKYDKNSENMNENKKDENIKEIRNNNSEKEYIEDESKIKHEENNQNLEINN